jgi:hypothetical protein
VDARGLFGIRFLLGHTNFSLLLDLFRFNISDLEFEIDGRINLSSEDKIYIITLRVADFSGLATFGEKTSLSGDLVLASVLALGSAEVC